MTPEKLSLEAAIARHIGHLQAGGYTEATLALRVWSLGLFRRWAEERGVCTLADLSAELAARYQRHLSQHRKENGQPLGQRTQRARLVPLRTFGKWLKRERFLHENPFLEMPMPRVGQPLPKAWLTAAQVETILSMPKMEGGHRPAVALRDRAILEVLYSTGLRRLELLNLRPEDLDFAGGALLVRQGKGRKDRVVPIGERALAWVSKYLGEARQRFVGPASELFVTERGERMTPKHLSALVTQYVEASGVGKAGSCHLFRHTCATLMLEGGADIRHVQEQLGHACLQTTQIYTHVSIRRLKEVHAATHPGAKLAARPKEEPAP